ncbi:MAG: Fic family protein [Corallococcus sp.]|nr:Fic family protein [Corallococcus sp.]MCM1359117.1 Fic family protein [Corallococcus sp.]MCM1394507.1 Fic family protein [Corallococcus sp.]
MPQPTVKQIILGNYYPTPDDLRYNQKLGYLFSKQQYEDFCAEKECLLSEDSKIFVKFPLKTFNSKYCYYIHGHYINNLARDYYNMLSFDYQAHNQSLIYRNFDDMLISRIFSEVEGTLNIENVPTTHKHIREVFNKKKLTDRNDIIIKNMQNALSFILLEKPDFNKENLHKLYCLLSDGCLAEDDMLPPAAYYRNDDVSVDGYDGAPVGLIDECMDSLFDFVKNFKGDILSRSLVPHVCHYYIVYIHPYFDYNGRTARMVSLWVSRLLDLSISPFYISEAINETRSEYYSALCNTRNTGNDLTYFLGYILETSKKFSFVYKNMEEIKKQLAKTGDFLSSSEQNYLKKIIAHNSGDYFNAKMFTEYIHTRISRQGAAKVLNNLVQSGAVVKSQNKKGETIYKVNQDFITYKFTD